MYLMHRISHENSASLKLLEEENLLPMGWSILKGEYADRVIINAKKMTKREFAKDFEEIGNELGNNGLTARKSYFLYNFLNLTSGDIIIIPRPGNIRICEVIAKPQPYTHPEGDDIGFVISVKTLYKKISRHQYVRSDLSSKLKYRGTNLVLNENDQKAIKEMMSRHQKGLPVYDFTETKNKIVKEVHEYIMKLTEVHFERLIASYLTFIGADTVKIPPKNNKSVSNDSIADIDVKAAFTNLDICIFVQAKRHKGKSSNFGIKQLLAYQTEEDEEFRNLQSLKWYITTAEIDDETIISAQNEYGEKVRVLQDREFASLLVDSGFIFSNDVYN